MPIERGGDAVPAFAAGSDEGRDRGNEHETAQCIGIAPGDARRRRAGAQRVGAFARTLDMRIPQRERIGILRTDREPVGDRGRRPVAQTTDAIEPAQRIADPGQAQKIKWRNRPQRGRREQAETGGTAKRRQPQP